MDSRAPIRIELVQQADYRFAVHFEPAGIAPLITDEGAPVGASAGPSPVQLLGTAVANCLAASLVFAMRKYKNEPDPVRVLVRVAQGRNAQGRLRVTHIAVDLHLGVAADQVRMLDRILAQFEEFCVVTQSVRAAIPVDVCVFDRNHAVLLQPPAA